MKTITVKNKTSRKIANALNKLMKVEGVCYYTRCGLNGNDIYNGLNPKNEIVAQVVVIY